MDNRKYVLQKLVRFTPSELVWHKLPARFADSFLFLKIHKEKHYGITASFDVPNNLCIIGVHLLSDSYKLLEEIAGNFDTFDLTKFIKTGIPYYIHNRINKGINKLCWQLHYNIQLLYYNDLIEDIENMTGL